MMGVTAELIGPELEGENKYRATAVLGRYVYALPWSATRTLRIDTATGEGVLLGPELPGSKKYAAAIAADDCIYGIPCDSQQAMRIRGSTGEVALIGPTVTGSSKYFGAARLGNHIYAVPYSADQVMRIECGSSRVDFVGPKLKGSDKYYSAATLGRHLVAPPCDGGRVLCVSRDTGTVELVGPPLSGRMMYTSAVAADEHVFALPRNTRRVLRVTPATGECALIGPELAGCCEYLCGLLAGKRIYGIPGDAKQVLQIETSSSEVSLVGPRLEGKFKYFVPTHGPDDCLKHVVFAKREEVLYEAAMATAAQPEEARGYAALVHAFTQESALYVQVTASMRQCDETLLSPWLEYIYHMQRGLNHQPRFRGTALRGIDILVPRSVYEPGTTITWQSFSSATRNVLVLLKFLKITEIVKLSGTVFVIQACNARCVRTVSAFPAEEEVIFGANTCYRVEEMITDEGGKRALLPELEDYDVEHLKVFRMSEL